MNQSAAGEIHQTCSKPRVAICQNSAQVSGEPEVQAPLSETWRENVVEGRDPAGGRAHGLRDSQGCVGHMLSWLPQLLGDLLGLSDTEAVETHVLYEARAELDWGCSRPATYRKEGKG